MKFTRLICSLLAGLSSSAFAQTAPQLEFAGVDSTGLWEQLGLDINGINANDSLGESGAVVL